MKYIKINQNQTAIEINKTEYDKLKKQCEFVFESKEVGIVDLYRDQVKPMIESAIIEKNGKSKIAKMFHINMLIMGFLALIGMISFIFTLNNKPSVKNKEIKSLVEKINIRTRSENAKTENSYIEKDQNKNKSNNTGKNIYK